jgi:Arc/MetJ-type ribon-helix-helix transcriptional regulator
MTQRTIRLPAPLFEEIIREAQERGYASTSAFIRAAIKNELHRDRVQSEEAVQLIETLRTIARDQSRLRTAQQAEFAFIDALARVILYCLAEPPSDLKSQALAQSKERYERLLKMAALQMQGDAQQVFAELTRHGE